MAALAACLAGGAAAQAQGFDIFHRQSAQPPANIPDADPDQAAGLVLRLNRTEEELRQANGRIEQLENAQRRLEDQLQKFRQDVEFRFGERSGGAPPAGAEPPATVAEAPMDAPPPMKSKKSDAFDPDADPNAPGAPRPLGTTAPSAPLVRETTPMGSQLVREAPAAGAPLELGKSQPPPPSSSPPATTGPNLVGSGVAMLDQPREQYNAALQALQSGQYAQAEDGFKAFLAANPSHRLSADAIFYIGET